MNNLLLNRVAFTIFGLDVYWYGIIITSAIVLDFVLLFFLCKKQKLNSDTPFDLLLFLVPLGILFARLFSVVFDSGLTIADYFEFRSGGMSIIGGLIGGTLGLALYCLIKRKNFLEIADIIAPLVILAQAIGRWGNYFNLEVYGKQILDESLQWFPLAVEVNGEFFMALFFYESMLNLLGFALMISLFFVKNKEKGVILATYLCYYGVVRFILEGFRQEEYILRLGSLPISRILSGVMVLIGVAIFAYIIVNKIKLKNKGNEKNGKKAN